MHVESYKSYRQAFEAGRDRMVEDWKTLLRFASISADPARKDACVACAQWLVEYARAMGFEAERIETSGLPVVYGERKGAAAGPTVLYYAHYDVQPVEPLDLWRSAPFEPVLKDGRLYARGAQDNKGQMMYALAAMRTLIQRGECNGPMKIVLEGEEESSGSGLGELLEQGPERFQADVLLVTDTGMDNAGHPAVTMGLRGAVQMEAAVRGAGKDLHSGIHGGVAPNAAHAAAQLVASLHHADGRVAVEDFYNVADPSQEERRLAAGMRLSAADYASIAGVAPLPGETRFTLAERIGFRPCLDVNGLVSGHTGPGVKTIIPGEALLKLSARIVPDQDPEQVLDLLERHLRRHTPSYARLTILRKKSMGPGLRVPLDSPVVATARGVLDRLSDKPTVFRWEGASIPIVAELARVAGATPLLVGFGLEKDNIHAPNESFSLDSMRMGYLYTTGLLSELNRNGWPHA